MMGEERLVKRVAMEALSLKGKMKWQRQWQEELGVMSCELWMG